MIDHAARRMIRQLEERFERMEASQQGQIDQIESEEQQALVDIAAVRDTLQAEINSLASSNPTLDLSGLQSVADQLDPAVKALGNITPEQPAPAPTPDPGPPAP